MVAFARKNDHLLLNPKLGAIVQVGAGSLPPAGRSGSLSGGFGRKTSLPGRLEYNDRWFSKSFYVTQPTAKEIDRHASLAQRQALLYEKRLGLWAKVRRFFAAL